MSNIKIEYKRFRTDWVDDVKNFFNKIWRRCMADVDLDNMEVENIKLLQETSKMCKKVIDESKDYVDVMNYQVKLLEDMADEMQDMNDRLKRLEAKK